MKLFHIVLVLFTPALLRCKLIKNRNEGHGMGGKERRVGQRGTHALVPAPRDWWLCLLWLPFGSCITMLWGSPPSGRGARITHVFCAACLHSVQEGLTVLHFWNAHTILRALANVFFETWLCFGDF